jgi:hypothetical protein
MSIGAGPNSFEPSSGPVCPDEEHSRLSCFDIALSAGLTSCDEAEFVRGRGVSECVMMDSFGLAPVLFFHFLEKEGNRVPKRFATTEPGESADLRFLNDEFAENSISAVSHSLKL